MQQNKRRPNCSVNITRSLLTFETSVSPASRPWAQQPLFQARRVRGDNRQPLSVLTLVQVSILSSVDALLGRLLNLCTRLPWVPSNRNPRSTLHLSGRYTCAFLQAAHRNSRPSGAHLQLLMCRR